ncbi:MAG: DUF2802 domain-containing protein [Nitrospirales bacterium]|nr:DUF2802 domain-containing protein [Nitrospirales bacterium]
MKIFTKKQEDKKEASAENLLVLQAVEIEEISERLFMKVEQKVKELRVIEERLDKKIVFLRDLLERAERVEVSAGRPGDSRYREITELAAKGLNIDAIAGVLDIPKGEVELILSLRK